MTDRKKTGEDEMVERVARALDGFEAEPQDDPFRRDEFAVYIQAAREARHHADFVSEIARIADDYIPDHDRDAPLALEEMRDALKSLLTKIGGES